MSNIQGEVPAPAEALGTDPSPSILQRLAPHGNKVAAVVAVLTLAGCFGQCEGPDKPPAPPTPGEEAHDHAQKQGPGAVEALRGQNLQHQWDATVMMRRSDYSVGNNPPEFTQSYEECSAFHVGGGWYVALRECVTAATDSVDDEHRYNLPPGVSDIVESRVPYSFWHQSGPGASWERVGMVDHIVIDNNPKAPDLAAIHATGTPRGAIGLGDGELGDSPDEFRRERYVETGVYSTPKKYEYTKISTPLAFQRTGIVGELQRTKVSVIDQDPSSPMHVFTFQPNGLLPADQVALGQACEHVTKGGPIIDSLTGDVQSVALDNSPPVGISKPCYGVPMDSQAVQRYIELIPPRAA